MLCARDTSVIWIVTDPGPVTGLGNSTTPPAPGVAVRVGVTVLTSVLVLVAEGWEIQDNVIGSSYPKIMILAKAELFWPLDSTVTCRM